ncbi:MULTISPECIES: DnaJ family domain-containing protein [Bacillaceae]|uniref:DUF1992 domain-containing protein n=1 Tax=Evansella alkalicola TaxID=745819 RepID=A0ABS6JYR4_9BACI|nr:MULTISPECIES: DnaJ family domain-containing protein [Bacillaceae]MBU9723737.1 DUF1992 domain-containing protein [Bacillus alkalicola]
MDESSSRDLMGEIYKEYEKRGGFEHLEGKGKPLSQETLNSDPLNSVIKNANYLPEWIKAQHKVRDTILELLQKREKSTVTEKEEKATIKEINNLIKKYNRQCPVRLQKAFVSLETLERDQHKWL